MGCPVPHPAYQMLLAEVADLRRQLGAAQRTSWQLDRDCQAHAEAAADLRRQLAEIRTAMTGYADSDLVSLGTTLRASADKSAEYYEAMKDTQEEAADLRRQLAEVPVNAMLECIGPNDYDFTAPASAVQRFAIWLEAQRAARQ